MNRSCKGASTLEFTLVTLVFLTAVLGVADFARALWQWNLSARATQIGARTAIVGDFAALNFRRFDGTLAAPIGAPVPVAAVTPNPTICTADGCGAALSSLDPALLDAAAFARILAPMRAAQPRIGAGNLILEYRHVGLGMSGNPLGPDLDPIVTVRLRGMTFAFFAISFLQLPEIGLPDFRTSLTAEDGVST